MTEECRQWLNGGSTWSFVRLIKHLSKLPLSSISFYKETHKGWCGSVEEADNLSTPSCVLFVLVLLIRNIVFLKQLKYGGGSSCEGTCWFSASVYMAPSISRCQRYKGYIAGRADCILFASLPRAGLSGLFSEPSCLVVFIQRAPGSHSSGLLRVSSSPPALELLLPAPVYSALLSKPRLNTRTQQLITGRKTSLEKACSSCCDVSGPFGGSRNVPHRSTNWVDCLGWSWFKWPQDVTIQHIAYQLLCAIG